MPRWLRSSATPQSRFGSDVEVDRPCLELDAKVPKQSYHWVNAAENDQDQIARRCLQSLFSP